MPSSNREERKLLSNGFFSSLFESSLRCVLVGGFLFQYRIAATFQCAQRVDRRIELIHSSAERGSGEQVIRVRCAEQVWVWRRTECRCAERSRCTGRIRRSSRCAERVWRCAERAQRCASTCCISTKFSLVQCSMDLASASVTQRHSSFSGKPSLSSMGSPPGKLDEEPSRDISSHSHTNAWQTSSPGGLRRNGPPSGSISVGVERPVSSSSSRTAAANAVSPVSMYPPGKDHVLGRHGAVLPRRNINTDLRSAERSTSQRLAACKWL